MNVCEHCSGLGRIYFKKLTKIYSINKCVGRDAFPLDFRPFQRKEEALLSLLSTPGHINLTMVLPILKTGMNNTFADFLRFHRSRLDLSQARAASLVGVPLRTLWSWENGLHAPNKITQRFIVATLENVRTDFLPTKIKQGRPLNREVIVVETELI